MQGDCGEGLWQWRSLDTFKSVTKFLDLRASEDRGHMVCITQHPNLPQGSSCLPQPVTLPAVSWNTSLLADNKAAPDLDTPLMVAAVGVLVLGGRAHWLFFYCWSSTRTFSTNTVGISGDRGGSFFSYSALMDDRDVM